MIKLAIIGTGNVAFHLAQAFHQAERIHLEAVAGRSRESLESFTEFAPVLAHSDKIPEVDVLVLAVSDAAIKTVSTELKDKDTLIVHTSGSTSVDVLSDHKRYGVFYPLQTFSKSSNLNYSEIPFCIEVKIESDFQLLEDLASALKAKSFKVNSDQRAALHLAAVFANNFGNHILTEARQICEERDVSFELLKPLMQETIRKAFDIGPQAAQTGPAKRRDTSTIEKQLNALHSDQQKELYTSLTKAILAHYER